MTTDPMRARLRALLLAAALAVVAPAAPAMAAPAGTPHLPDLQTVIPLSQFSVLGTGADREFRYTHQIYNAGPGPLEVQPSYSDASGGYRGTQMVFTHDAAGNWSQVRTARVPDAFVFHAEHGHFHFPLASFGLYTVAADGGIGTPVALSPKIGFCIDDSYIYNSSVAHAGTFVGSKGGCGDPLALRGMSVGAADEYDYRDPGQSIPFAGVPDGTYWFKAVSDPNNDFEEADESNNETDVKVTVSNGTVTTGEVRTPDTTPPPVTLTAPTDWASVSGTVQLSATTPVSDPARVEFVVDGTVVGASADPVAPFRFAWDTTRIVDGEHWVEARLTDSRGRINTSTVTRVNVANTGGNVPPTGVFAIDGRVSANGSGTVTTPPLQTTRAGDLLLAFVSSDGPSSAGGQTATVSGGGLAWTLVKRQNTRWGTSEIWKTFAPTSLSGLGVTSTQLRGGYDQAVHVVAFANSGGVGATGGASAASGAPSTGLTTSQAGSWVFGVGNDWDSSTARIPGADQTLGHQWLDSRVGDTFWMQNQNNPTPVAGTPVLINDTSPTGDQWNLAAVEVLSNGAAPPPPPVDSTPPKATITDPPAGATLSGIVTLGATATDDTGVKTVQFKVDGAPMGAPVAAPPFMTTWDTRTAGTGTHTITAEAVDAAGNVGASAPVTVTVDNTAPPPAAITVDTKQSFRGRGTLRTPALTTPTAGDTLVAFVAYDGPGTAQAQRATVTGGGLTWTLVKRSDSQGGVSEIWSARATGTLTNQVITATPQRAGYDGILHVMAFKGAAGVGVAGAAGAPTGAPEIYLPGVPTGAWMFAVGNDWDRAVARTPASGQTLQYQWVDSAVGDTFWVQSTNAPNTAPGLVTIRDTAPTGDQWNYAAVAVLPAAGG